MRAWVSIHMSKGIKSTKQLEHVKRLDGTPQRTVQGQVRDSLGDFPDVTVFLITQQRWCKSSSAKTLSYIAISAPQHYLQDNFTMAKILSRHKLHCTILVFLLYIFKEINITRFNTTSCCYCPRLSIYQVHPKGDICMFQ